MPETSTRRPRTVERRIAFMFAAYRSLELTADGTYMEMIRTAKRGELVTLSVGEAARLDALGALAPVGCSAEDITADIEATYQIYQQARRTIPEGA